MIILRNDFISLYTTHTKIMNDLIRYFGSFGIIRPNQFLTQVPIMTNSHVIKLFLQVICTYVCLTGGSQKTVKQIDHDR